MESYYIRIRGRVLGPYDTEKLQSLAMRGQLSRMHEVSTDGVSWVRASSFPELFEVKQPEPSVSVDAERAPATPPPVSGPPASEYATNSGGSWHYSLQGKQMPPTDFAGLQWLATTGAIGPDTQVWQEGMREWVPARTVSGLAWPTPGASQSPPSAGASAKSRDDLPIGLCHTALGSRGWAMFLAILGLTTGTIVGVYGACVLLIGASRHVEVLVGLGITSIVQAAILIVGSRFLLGYASALAGLRYAASSSILIQSLESLKRFWIFVGITVIVIMVLFFLIFIAALAGAASMPEMTW